MALFPEPQNSKPQRERFPITPEMEAQPHPFDKNKSMGDYMREAEHMSTAEIEAENARMMEDMAFKAAAAIADLAQRQGLPAAVMYADKLPRELQPVVLTAMANLLRKNGIV